MKDIIEEDGEAAMLEIIDLLNHYAWSLDKSDVARLNGVFSEHAVATVKVAGKYVSVEPWNGRDEIVEMLMSKRASNPNWRSHQLTTPLFIALERDRATVKTYLSLFACERGQTPEIAVTGEYLAQVAGAPGAWKIDRLELTLDSDV